MILDPGNAEGRSRDDDDLVQVEYPRANSGVRRSRRIDPVGGRVTFEGKKQIISGRIRSVGRKQMGMNRWVHVQYDTDGETRDAYFMDGDALGWAGVFWR